MNLLCRYLHVAVLLAFGVAHATAEPSQDTAVAALNADMPRASLQIATADGQLHTFRVWIADTESRRQRGLMFVRRMDPSAGMLFIYPRVQPVAMWMKNTFIPLDMLFVAADGRVVRVAAHTTPQSLESIPAGQDVLGVVELNAGVAEKLKIRAGAQVIHPAFLPR